VSGNHCEITNGFALDRGSTNGTLLNGAPIAKGAKKMLKAGDKLQIGDRILRIEAGPTRNDDDQGLSRSKKFLEPIDAKKDSGKEDEAAAASSAAAQKEADEEAKMTVEELMDKEFAKIIGHDSLKKQLRQFYKKVQLDQIRIKAGKEKDGKRLYHMIFSGPPGTGEQCGGRARPAALRKPELIRLRSVSHCSALHSAARRCVCNPLRQNHDGELGVQDHVEDETSEFGQGCVCEQCAGADRVVRGSDACES